jgi:hypothetical protein
MGRREGKRILEIFLEAVSLGEKAYRLVMAGWGQVGSEPRL